MRNWLSAIRERARHREASAWLLQLCDEELAPEQIAAWLRWGQAHPDNLQAFEEARSLLQKLQGLDGELKSIALRRLLGEPARRGLHWGWLLAGGLAVATAIVVVCSLAWRPLQTPARFVAQFTTVRAQERRVSLPDGTGIELGARSRLAVELTRQTRTVELGEGEAFFQVKHEQARPFVVRAGAWQLIDMGTSFNVRKTKDHVVLTVSEGAVEISRRAEADATDTASTPVQYLRPVRLVAGEQIMLDASADSMRLAKVEAAAAFSWEHGQLRFADEPLSVVVANLNRYSQREIVIADADVATMRFSGTVLTDNVNGWLAAACRVFSLHQEQGPNDQVLLYRGAADR